MDAFLQQAGNLGAFNSEGVFTLSPEQAAKKLARFQLPFEEAWLVKVAQAAVASGAEQLEVHQARGITFFSFQPAEFLDIQEVYRVMVSEGDSSVRAIRHLASGLRAVGLGKGRPFTLSVEHGSEQSLLGWDGTRLGSAEKKLAGSDKGLLVQLGVGHPAQQPEIAASELKELAARTEASPIPIVINGKRVDHLNAPLIDPGHGLGSRTELSVGWCPYDAAVELPPLRLPRGVMLRDRGLQVDDSFTAERAFLVDGDPLQQEVCSVVKLSYGYHVSSHRVATGRFQFHNVPRYSYIHWIRDGVICESHRWMTEPSAVAFDLYLSADGLPTDASGLQIVRRPDVAHRIKRALPSVCLQAERTAQAITKRFPRPFGSHAAMSVFFGFVCMSEPVAALFKVLLGGVAASYLGYSMYDKHQLMRDAVRNLQRMSNGLSQ